MPGAASERGESEASTCYFLDWETSEPARAFVDAAELPFCRAAEAFASIGLLVVLLVPACASALPAKLFCNAEALELPSVRPAEDATLPPVDFPAILNLQVSRLIHHPLLVDVFDLETTIASVLQNSRRLCNINTKRPGMWSKFVR